MPKTYQFTKEQYDKVIELSKRTKETKISKKLEVLRLRMEGYKNKEIATQYSKSRVSALVSIYAKEGIGYFEKESRVGGNRRNMSFQDELAILAEFEMSAKAGNVITVSSIKVAYDEKCGHESGEGTICKILKRHNWRKVMPRSKHPNKASDEAIEASKKLTIGL